MMRPFSIFMRYFMFMTIMFAICALFGCRSTKSERKSLARCFYRIEDIEWDLKKYKSTLTPQVAAQKAYREVRKIKQKSQTISPDDTIKADLEKFTNEWLSEEKIARFYAGDERAGNFSVAHAHFRWFLPEREVWYFKLFRFYRP